MPLIKEVWNVVYNVGNKQEVGGDLHVTFASRAKSDKYFADMRNSDPSIAKILRRPRTEEDEKTGPE